MDNLRPPHAERLEPETRIVSRDRQSFLDVSIGNRDVFILSTSSFDLDVARILNFLEYFLTINSEKR